MTEGRAFLDIGSGDSAVYNIGLAPASRARMEDYITCVRDLGRSTSLLSLDTSGEPGEFSIELPLRILVIDRTMDELVAVCCGPAHPSLGKECSQHGSRPVVLE